MPPPPASPGARGAPGAFAGPGERARELAAVLAALRAGPTRALADVAELAGLAAEDGELWLDADALAFEDLGYVRRFAASRPRFALIAFGDDPAGRVARWLGAQGARWVAWPPDLDQLRGGPGSVAGATRASAPPEPFHGTRHGTPARTVPAGTAPPGTASPRALRAGAGDELDGDVGELELVRAILAGGDGDAETELEADVREEIEEVEVEEDEEREAPAPPPSPAPRAEAGAEPPWLRAQIADLADATQRVDLALHALEAATPELSEGGPGAPQEAYDGLRSEIARLTQFARTLGYVVAPPARGAQRVDVGEMLHLFSSQLAAHGPDGPRCQFRSPQKLVVRSDRQLLAQVLDALFFVVRASAGRGDSVRSQAVREDGPDGAPRAVLKIDFPARGLDGMSETEVLAPYALKEIVPDLGPNALAAAKGILVGQGGSLALAPGRRGRLEWRLELPLDGA